VPVLTRRETLKFALAALASGYSSGYRGSLPLRAAAVPPPQPDGLTRSNSEFASRLYRQLAAEPETETTNLLVSPYSVSSALAMTLAGARGATAAQMQQVLQLSPPLSDVHRGFGQLNRWFNRTDKGYELTVSNALWGDRSVEFAQGFLATLATHYEAPLTPVDFQRAPEASRTKINDAIEAATHAKIRELLPSGSITALTRLVLTNAIHFKGLWLNQFAIKATTESPFRLLNGDQVSVPMMHQQDDYDYTEVLEGRLQLAALPYRGDGLRMLILLPRDAQTLATVEELLSAEVLDQWTSQLSTRSLVLRLPRFKFEFASSLKQTLMALGMQVPFSDAADFSAMASVATAQGFYLSDVVHKAFIEVNEEGTEAAAATGAIVAARALPRQAEFTCDRPFLFVIQDRKTKTSLMMGKVVNPAKLL
jgi:serpin B